MSKELIAYFSVAGNNYWNGQIVNLEKGNTEKVAEKLQTLTGANIYEIRTPQKYAADYEKRTEETKAELRSHARPLLSEKLPDMTDFDVLYLGYPIWWGMMPMPVLSFLENIDTSDKIIRPFCTHEGNGLGNSLRWLKHSCPL